MQKALLGKLDVAYATSFQTLEDYAKSDICKGRDIYCSFDLEESWVVWLEIMIEKNGIRSFSFRDGSYISSSTL